MIKHLYILPVILLLIACSSDDYIGGTTAIEHPISVGGNAGMITRATENGLEQYLPEGNKSLLLYGMKNEGTADAESWQDVFQNYVLTWQANTAGTTTTNTSNWEYVGNTSVGNQAVTQTIKYWDYSTNTYVFSATAPNYNRAGTKNETAKTMAFTSPELTVANYAANPFYYTQPQKVAKTSYNQPVSLLFRNVASKVRVGIYETIPGYKITNIKFYTSAEAAVSPVTAPTLFTTGTGNSFYAKGTYTVTGNYSNSETTVVFTGGTDSEIASFFHVGKTGDEGNIASAVSALGTNSNQASFGKSDLANGYVYAFSNRDVARTLAIKCDYTLESESNSSTDVIHITGQTAYVPEQYGKWLPNYAYTYLFKITDAGAGLYPISFDACVETFGDKDNDGTVTIVAKPSITTWQEGSVHSGDASNPDKDVEYVIASSLDDEKHDIDVTVSFAESGITPESQQLDVCYFGPQVTEAEFEYYDKQAHASGKEFVWAELKESQGADFTATGYNYRDTESTYSPYIAFMDCKKCAFRPLLGGYYAIRCTYTVADDTTTYYAYKIVKVGNYSFIQSPKIYIDDDYQNGVVIE
ncbi:MAG: hypothetical protein KBT33_04020 [Prevotellaceae bacterium]|nr:hypothetical protein [Candidatus Minthosoma equi]